MVILQESKDTSAEISIRFKESELLNVEITKIRESYRSVARRGSLLYFVISDVSLIDAMYQYSLVYVKKLFRMAMEATPAESDLPKRLDSLLANIQKVIYTNITRSLFEAHKGIYSLLICLAINIDNEVVNPALLDCFLRGAGKIDNKIPPNPDAKFITESAWDLAYFLECNFDKYKNLCNDLKSKLGFWKEFARANEPYQRSFPPDWESRTKKMDSFDKLMMIRILRKEKLQASMSMYIEECMGPYYVGSLNVRMEDVFLDADRQTPIIFVLSQGADPTSIIKKLGESKGFIMGDRLRNISLGDKQGPKAERLINEGMEKGNWVMLENCHLAQSWMPDLERLVKSIQERPAEKIHPDFILYLTSSPADYFPVAVLQNSLKMTTEPPRGIKANFTRSLNSLDSSFLDGAPLKEAMHRLTLGLCFLHAILQERKKFGPLGWNKKYDFNDSDFETSKNVLHLQLESVDLNEHIPWDSIVFLVGHINYGGRVTDDLDRRMLLTIVKKFFQENTLNPKFEFCSSDVYYLPRFSTLESYYTYAETLPSANDDPEIFGMHNNASITFQSQETNKILETIVGIKPTASGGVGGKTPSEQILEIAGGMLEPEQGVPQPIKAGREDTHFEFWKTEDDSEILPSLTTVFQQESEKFNALLSLIKKSLQD